MNGGMIRCFNIMLQLSQRTELTVITFLEKQQILEMISDYRELEKVSFISINFDCFNSNYNFFNRLKNALISRALAGVNSTTNSILLVNYFMLKSLLVKNKYDLLILEQIDLIPLAKKFKIHFNKIIFDAHNFETEIAKQKLNNRTIRKREFKRIRKIEFSLPKIVNEIWTCSFDDKIKFENLFGLRMNMQIVPNGANLHESTINKVFKSNNKNILFCGSLNYSPNSDGLVWFLTTCWERILKLESSAKLIIIGSGNVTDELLFLTNIPSIQFVGTVSKVEDYYLNSSVVISPILSGSGTRLKILEAMSYCVPIVSTSKGAEGLNCSSDHILVADSSSQFIENVVFLLQNLAEQKRLAENSKSLIENFYSWKKIFNNVEI